MSTRQSTSRASSKQGGIPSLWLATLVCTLATSFLLYEFILQVSPSVMTRELMYAFRLNKAWFGAIIAFYSYAYTIMQLPAGLLFDRFGPRKLLTLATLVCAAGALLFGMANEWIVLSLGRLLMGAGSAFAFTGALVVVANWFPPRYFSILAGIVQLASSIGAIAGQVTLVPLLKKWGWRSAINYLGYTGIGLALLIWLIVRDTPDPNTRMTSHTKYSWKQEIKKLLLVLNNPQTWWIGLYSLAVWAPIASFTGLWGIPFLRSAYGLSAQAASNAFSITWLAVGIGSILLGWWSDHIKQRRLPLTLSALVGIIGWLILLYGRLSHFWLYVDLCVIGLAATGQALAFAAVKENNRPEVIGTAVGINNTAVVAGGAIFQPLLGFLLKWDQKAFLTLPLCYLVAIVISQFLVRETNCKPRFSATKS
jgi:MFS family permease